MTEKRLEVRVLGIDRRYDSILGNSKGYCSFLKLFGATSRFTMPMSTAPESVISMATGRNLP
ncbi:MAG: hypothetical protein ACI4T9_06405 [Prevotella sp.]